jgi:hypothetical protein
MLLADTDIFMLPTALVVKVSHRHYATIRDCYPGWNDVHLQALGFVVMTAENGNPVDGGPLYFWIPTRDKEAVEPGIDFWELFWSQVVEEALRYQAAFSDKKESHEIKGWVATLARGERDTRKPDHHAFADLGLVNDGIKLCIAHCSTFDLRTLGAFLTRYALAMEKGNTP